MNIIHAHYQPPQNADDPVGIYFWAETPDTPQPSPRRGRAAKIPKPKVHPFATAPTIKGEKRTLTLQLPDVRGIPTPSPQLIHNWEIPASEKMLSPFYVDAIWVPAPDAVRKAAQGEAILDSRVASRIIQELQGIRKNDVNPFVELSEREFDVLRLIAAGKSNSEIAETLVIGESTVKTHVSNLLKKLHLDDRTQAAVYAWQQGIVRRKK